MAQRQRETARRGRRNGLQTGLLWSVVIVVVAAIGVFAARDAGAAHPRPRPDAHAHHVVPAERYEGYPRVARAYAMAGEIKDTLDGIYCYCLCSRHSGHYSLLECFESDHGARCDVCMSEAELAYRLLEEGSTLKEIRRAVDALYGS